MDDEILKLDLYEIIGATQSSNESEIKKAYRKKALSCHPDKNPDNPKAAELFLQLSKALEILTDSAAKAAYDKVINARVQAKLRTKQLDAKRKKFKDDLEAREEAFKRSQTSTSLSDEVKLKNEIERLRREGSKLVEEEKERLRQKIIEELKRQSSGYPVSEDAYQVNIKWKVGPEDDSNGGYNYDNLKNIFSKWGEVKELVLLPNKKGKALVEFSTPKAAECAVNYERGFIKNPLYLKGVWEKNKVSQPTYTNLNVLSDGKNLFPSTSTSTSSKRKKIPEGLSFSSCPDIFNTQPSMTYTENTKSPKPSNFESIVLNNLKREEERKRLIEQMKLEDENE